MKRIFLILLALLLVAVIRTLLRGRKVSAYTPSPDPEKEALCAEKLSAMVRCETTSYRDVADPEKFAAFVHSLIPEKLTKEVEKMKQEHKLPDELEEMM